MVCFEALLMGNCRKRLPAFQSGLVAARELIRSMAATAPNQFGRLGRPTLTWAVAPGVHRLARLACLLAALVSRA